MAGSTFRIVNVLMGRLASGIVEKKLSMPAMLANFSQARQFKNFYPNDLRPEDALAVAHPALLLSKDQHVPMQKRLLAQGIRAQSAM